MPALSFPSANPLLPQPVTLELAFDGGDVFKNGWRRAMTACFYPELIVVDGWMGLPDWLSSLEYSRTVPRTADAAYEAIAECILEVEITCTWEEIIAVLRTLDPALADGVQACLARASDHKVAGVPAEPRCPNDDLEVLLHGFAVCLGAPHIGRMMLSREIYQSLRKSFQAALRAHLSRHGRFPDGEVCMYVGARRRPVLVDCAVLRAASLHGRCLPGFPRAFYSRKPSLAHRSGG